MQESMSRTIFFVMTHGTWAAPALKFRPGSAPAYPVFAFLHENPVTVELVLCLDEVAPVGPEGAGAVRKNDGSASTAAEPRDELQPFVVVRYVLALARY